MTTLNLYSATIFRSRRLFQKHQALGVPETGAVFFTPVHNDKIQMTSKRIFGRQDIKWDGLRLRFAPEVDSSPDHPRSKRESWNFL